MKDIRFVAEAELFYVNVFLREGWRLLSVMPVHGRFELLVGTTESITNDEFLKFQKSLYDGSYFNSKSY